MAASRSSPASDGGTPLKVATDIEFRRRAQTDADAVPTGQPWRGGTAIGPVVEAALLEAAVEGSGFLLLFLTDDVPFEDRLSIVLISGAGQLLDQAVIGGPYTTGSFNGLRPQGDNRVHFRFAGDTDWCVQVLPQPQWRWPLSHDLADPRGVTRPFGWRRRFRLSGNPQPQV